MANPVTYNGTTYKSLAELARAYDIAYPTLLNRINMGYTVEQAVNWKKIKVYDKYYASIAEVAREFDIEPGVLTKRIKAGYTLEQSIEWCKVQVFGKWYPSMKAAADKFDIPYRTLINRTKRGKTLEEAVSLGTSGRQVTVYGVEYMNLGEVAKHFNINLQALHGFLKKTNSIEEAVELCKSSPNKIKFRGKTYSSVTDICIDYSVTVNLVIGRLNKGWDLERAVLEPPTTQTNGKPVNYRGVTYQSLNDACLALGLDSDFLYRLGKKYNKRSEAMLELVDTFLAQYKGYRPQLLTKLPLYIYNGEWFFTLRDLSRKVGLKQQELPQFLKNHKYNNHLEALAHMVRYTTDIWVDKKTGERVKSLDMLKKYGKQFPTCVKEGLVVKKKVKVFPHCTFNPVGYCASPKEDFDRMMKRQ